MIGGGSAPDVRPMTWLITLSSTNRSVDDLETRLRAFEPPVIARIAEDKVVIDLRTVFEDEESQLIAAVSSLVK